jgi:putative methionine-R-sulfoxide reductase with GAF domain
MEQNKLQTYKTKISVLMGIAAIVFVLLIVILFIVFKHNKELMDHSSGLLVIICTFILLVVFLLVLNNLFKYFKFSGLIIVENERLKQEKLKIASAKNIEEAEKEGLEKEDSEKSILEEIWEEVKKDKGKNSFTESFLINLSKKVEIVQGLFYLFDKKEKKFKVSAKYAYYNEEEPETFDFGEGLSGQVAKDMKPMIITDIPENYLTVISGLGSSSPTNLLILPVIYRNKVIGIIELASYIKIEILPEKFVEFLKGISENFVQEKKK